MRRDTLSSILPSLRVCPCARPRSKFRNITGSVLQTGQGSKDDLFNYNEHLQLTERYLEFDVPALKKAIAAASGHFTSDIISFFKLSEGGFNRLFQATFNDGKHIIARIPYPSTGPEHYAVASEVATLDYVRLHGFTTPNVYAWCSTRANPVGAEYIIMEKLDSLPLGDVWFIMTPKDQHRIMKQIVEWETRLMSLEFPASGSIYYRKGVLSGEGIPLLKGGHEFCTGPIAHYSWWHDKRAVLKTNRGAWLLSHDIFQAVGERELKWAESFAEPRLMSAFTERSIIFCLGFKTGSSLNRPVIRHHDFKLNNILMSKTNEIVGLVDWQHSANYGDPDSEKVLEPQINLPPNYDWLDLPEQMQVRETIPKRLVHFLYADFTKRLNEEHYDAIFNQSEGASTTLQADRISTIQSYGKEIYTMPPLEYPDTVIQETLHVDAQQREADTAMEQMRDLLGVDILGWVPNDQYKAAKEVSCEMKAKMPEAVETPSNINGVQNNFPFDDFDENS
ncbi:phosphotransferase family protein [Aspergillus lucknowensis]|uniref:Kinase-like domain-containing protein n=1 Tax=Aspergillus lucknowensis TaxID=176173 RepID=A0ABR4M7X2_9EURO